MMPHAAGQGGAPCPETGDYQARGHRGQRQRILAQ